MNKKGMNLALTFSGYTFFIILIILIILFFAMTILIVQFQKTFFFFGEKNEIAVSKHISCERELYDVLQSFLSSDVVINGERKKISEAIGNSNLNVDMFNDISENFFRTAFPGGILEEKLPAWKVKITDSEGRYLMEGNNLFENGGMDCYDQIVSEIILENKKIVACLFKSYCEEIK